MNKTLSIELPVKDLKASLESFKNKKESVAQLLCKDSFLVLKNDSCMVSVPCTIHESFCESYSIDSSMLYGWLDTFESNETLFMPIFSFLTALLTLPRRGVPGLARARSGNPPGPSRHGGTRNMAAGAAHWAEHGAMGCL